MKSQKFLWLLFPIALAISTGVCFTSCNDSVTDELQTNTETVAPATNDDGTSVSFRSCVCSTSCPLDLVIVSGTNVDVTICGDLNGATACASFTSSCGSGNHAFASTFNTSGCFCVANGRSFRVTNNSLSSVTFNIVVTGGSGTYPLGSTVTLTSGTSRDFESPTSSTCDNPVIVCP